MEMYYVNQIFGRQIHLKLVKLVKQIKSDLEDNKVVKVQGMQLLSKDEEYYKFLGKILKFLGTVIQEEAHKDSIVKEVIFGIWGFFFESNQNQVKESDQINKFLRTFLDKYINLIETSVISDFLVENIPKMEFCKSQEFFKLFRKLVFHVNEKNGKVEKDEVVLDRGYFNDYSSKKLEFYVLKVPSEELDFYPELESLFLSSKNYNLEPFLCNFLCTLIT